MHKDNKNINKTKRFVHIGFSVLLFLVILIFNTVNDENVVSAVFKAAGYTYGPILGLFAFGLISKRKVLDKAIPFIAIISPILLYFINMFSEELLFGYKFGFELLILNGALTFFGLFLFSKREEQYV